MGNAGGNGVYLELAAGRVGCGRYQPGETIGGTAHLHIQRALNVKGVMLKVTGVEKAQWEERRTVQQNGHSHTETIHHWQKHEYFKVRIPLMYPSGQGMLAVGQYSVPFSFVLPANCLPSFFLSGHDWQCSVTYKVKVVCDVVGMFKSDLKDRRAFDVTGVMPANPTPLSLRDCKKVPKFCCCGNAGMLLVDLNLERNTWFAGDQVESTGTITNGSTKQIDKVNFRVRRILYLHPGRGRNIASDAAHTAFPGIAPGEKSEGLRLTLNLPPSLVPTCHGRTFDLSYVVSVDCDVPWAVDPEAHAEVVVCAAHGTAPPPMPPPPAVPGKWQPAVLQPVVVPALVCAA